MTPISPTSPRRYDTYRTFKFQIFIDDKPVADFKKMSVLKKNTEVSEWRDAEILTENYIVPGRAISKAVTLDQGLRNDPVFEDWTSLVNNIEDDGMSLVNCRNDIVIKMLDLLAKVVRTCKLLRAYVSEH